jgi:hypothetical protein
LPVIVLVLIAAGLGLGNWHLYRQPVSTVSAPAAGIAEAPASGSARDLLESLSVPPITAFSEILERPVFSPDRRPPEVKPDESGTEAAGSEMAPAAETSAASASLPDRKPTPEPHGLKLAGVLIENGTSRALIRAGDGSAGDWRMAGETVEGWTIRTITAGSVELEGAQGRVTLLLYEN